MNTAKNYPLHWWEGIEGRGISFGITLSPPSPIQGEGV